MNYPFNVKFFFVGLVIFFFVKAEAQKNIITAGFQYKPIFASHFFNKSFETITPNNIDFAIKPTYGFCAGMSVRRGITSSISFETGINYVKRTYQLSITDSRIKRDSEFSIIGYEIPLMGLVFIRLSDKLYMDAGLGTSLDMFPTNIYTSNVSYFSHFSAKRNWLLPAVFANLGFEYRTLKNGYFYFGTSYHRPFTDIYTSRINYFKNNFSETIQAPLQGSYLTLDLRYFFHSDPIKEKKEKN